MISEVYQDVDFAYFTPREDSTYDVANRVKEKFKDFVDIDLGGLNAI